MTIEQVLGAIAILGTGLALMRWVIRNEVREVAKDTKAIKYETTPNSGSSMNDYIKKEIHPLLKEIRSDQIEIKVNVGTLEGSSSSTLGSIMNEDCKDGDTCCYISVETSNSPETKAQESQRWLTPICGTSCCQS